MNEKNINQRKKKISINEKKYRSMKTNIDQWKQISINGNKYRLTKKSTNQRKYSAPTRAIPTNENKYISQRERSLINGKKNNQRKEK